MARCTFETKYRDYDTSGNETFRCDNPSEPQMEVCMFHNPNFKKKDLERMEEALAKKINAAISNDTVLYCIGYNLHDLVLEGREFHKSVYFSDSSIVGNVKINSRFCKHVSFNNAHFQGGGNVSFTDSTFEATVSFSRARFQVNNVDFTRTHFKGGDVYFLNAQFNASAYFSAAHFEGNKRIDFSGVHFEGNRNVDFYRAHFQDGDVYMAATVFEVNDVTFDSSIFEGKGKVTFASSRFKGGDVNFTRCHFLKEGTVDFTRANFEGKGDVKFSGSRFYRNVLFLECKFNTNVLFSYVNFMSPDDVRFATDNLSYVTFLNTDITRVFFDENIQFGELAPKRKKYRIKVLSERFKIFDDRRFEKFIDKKESKTHEKLKETGLSLGTVLTSYRNLRENYEYRLRYEEAGQFFVREMEIRRKYREEFSIKLGKYIPKRNNWIRRNFSFIGLYHNICNYGESSTRPLILFGVILFLSMTYWLVSSSIGLALEKNLLTTNCNESLIFCSLERILSDIVGFPEKGIIVDYATRISSIIVLVTLFLPFRRKFERRFRH